MTGHSESEDRTGQCGGNDFPREKANGTGATASNWMNGSYTVRQEDAREVEDNQEEEEVEEAGDAVRCSVGRFYESNCFGSWYTISPLLTSDVTPGSTSARGPGCYDNRPTNQAPTSGVRNGFSASADAASPLTASLFRLA